MFMNSYCYIACILCHCVVLCTVCVYMCTVLLPPGVNPTALDRYIISSFFLPATYLPQPQPFWCCNCLSPTQKRWQQGICDCLQTKAVCCSGYRWLCCVCVLDQPEVRGTDTDRNNTPRLQRRCYAGGPPAGHNKRTRHHMSVFKPTLVVAFSRGSVWLCIYSNRHSSSVRFKCAIYLIYLLTAIG